MQLPQYDTLLTEVRGPALVVTINRPKALNALSQAVVADLADLTRRLAEIGRDGDWPVRGVIFTGAGEKSFVAGADIVEMNSMNATAASEYGRSMHRVTQGLEGLPVPAIAAVNGFALGGGCELALACDFIFASSSARFGQPEVGLGLVPGFGGSVRLPRRISPGLARELILTGRQVTADEALRIGLVNSVHEDKDALLAAAVATVESIAAHAPTAVSNAKTAMEAMVGLNTAEALEVEAESFRTAFLSQDSVEGRTAFVEKRRPEFPGK
ncbi:MAG: enoyl-CoA hydratase/isomerase family protein [Galactobacter sp.]